MRERREVKFKVNMLSDTKFKIIDTKPERDMIHYVWMGLVLLAGRVNLEGDLYLSRNLPHTIETLAIEFNRSEEQIKLALEVFIELEMLEVIDGRIYRVKNFAKHQNIKVKEKINSEDKEDNVKNIEAATEEVVINEAYYKEEKKSNKKDEEKESENNVVENEKSTIVKEDKRALEINNNINNKENNLSSEIVDNSFKDNIPISLETRKNKKGKGKKKKETLFNMTDEEEIGDNEIISFAEEERPLGEEERVIFNMIFDAEDFTEECFG